MSAIEKFKTMKRDVMEATRWASLIGAPYNGGGGGIGSVREITFKAEVYHQAYNGANNYHTCPERLSIAIADVIRSKFDTILEEARNNLEVERLALAKQATEEHAALMQEAGL